MVGLVEDYKVKEILRHWIYPGVAVAQDHKGANDDISIAAPLPNFRRASVVWRAGLQDEASS